MLLASFEVGSVFWKLAEKSLHWILRFVITSLFGEIELNRNYYRDRETGEYVFLLDRYLEFEDAGSFSPLIEEVAIELAVQGPSYRKAASTLETLLGYRVI